MLLDGKRLLITGVLTDDSIAWHTARIAQEQGANIVCTGFGRGLRLTERSVQRLPNACDVLELDINDPDHVEAMRADLTDRWGAVDGALHAIAFAPADALGGNFLATPVESAQTAFTTSAFSYKTLAVGLLPLMEAAGGGALVTLDFDNTQAWPAYDWMGVSKAALQAVTRYLARDLGPKNIRVNAVSAGPLATVAANPKVELCYTADSHDQVRITGTAQVLEDRPLLEEIWNANPLLRAYLGSADNPALIIYRIIPNRVRYMKEWALEYHEVPLA